MKRLTLTTFDDLHDARLLALIADGDGRFTLRFKTDVGKICDVILDRAERLLLFGWSNGSLMKQKTG